MHLATSKFLNLVAVSTLALLLSACSGDELEKLTSSGGGSEATSSATSDSTSSTASRNSNDFSLVFDQKYQACSDCGIWFDSAELVLVTDKGTFRFNQSGSMLIKQNPFRRGFFRANLSAVPKDARIQSATLYMHLNHHEGIANSDKASIISVSGYVNGSLQYVRDITAAGDIKGRGYSKANPSVPFDFTQFARRL